MLRSELFTLLRITESEIFVKSKKQIRDLKRGLFQLCQKNEQDLPDEISEKDKEKQKEKEKKKNDDDDKDKDKDEEPLLSWFGKFIKGWSSIINDMVNKNNLQDVLSVNQPKELDDNDKNGGSEDPKNSFVYSTFLPAGHHQFFIWCPKTKRAFCKDLIVHQNTVDIYPELPSMVGMVGSQKQPQNVWKRFTKLTDQTINTICSYDMESSKYNIARFVKQPDIISQINSKIKERFKVINVYYTELLVLSNKFPRIDFESFKTSVLEQNDTILQVAQFELSF